MYRARNGVEEALVGVGSEIHGDLRAGRDGSDDFDIEQHFAIGAVGIARRLVLGSIDRDGSDRGRSFDTKPSEVGLEIGGLIAAPKFNNGDGLSGSGSARGIVIELGDRWRRVRCV